MTTLGIAMQILSLVGAGLTLFAYGALTRRRWTPTSRAYLYMNLASTVLLLTVAVYSRSAGYIVLNAAWGIFTYSALRSREA